MNHFSVFPTSTIDYVNSALHVVWEHVTVSHTSLNPLVIFSGYQVCVNSLMVVRLDDNVNDTIGGRTGIS